MTAVPVGELPFVHAFAEALRGEACDVVGLDDGPVRLPVERWREDADETDQALLDHCVGHTLDVGCGPGRMCAHLMRRGQGVLGIDLVAEAVRQARHRGVAALRRDVFASLPGEGRWDTVLLADGNIGIGGEPRALLARVVALLAPAGRAVVDVAPPGAGAVTHDLVIRTTSGTSRPFRWTVVGVDAIGPLAAAAGFASYVAHEVGGRWFVVLDKH